MGYIASAKPEARGSEATENASAMREVRGSEATENASAKLEARGSEATAGVGQVALRTKRVKGVQFRCFDMTVVILYLRTLAV